MIIWKRRIGDQLFRITHHYRQGRRTDFSASSQVKPKGSWFPFSPPQAVSRWCWFCWLFAISLGVLTLPCRGLPWITLEPCSHYCGKLCRTVQTNTAGGVHIWGKPPNLAKMIKKKRFILCHPTVWTFIANWNLVIQVLHRCFTFKTKLLHGCKLSELMVSMGASV